MDKINIKFLRFHCVFLDLLLNFWAMSFDFIYVRNYKFK